MNSPMISCIDISTLLVKMGASIHRFSTKSVSSLIVGSFLMFELKVEFNKNYCHLAYLKVNLG